YCARLTTSRAAPRIGLRSPDRDLLLEFSASARSVLHLKHRRILRPRFSVIVHPRRADIGVTEPFLDLRDVGAGVQRIRGGRRARGVWTESLDRHTDPLHGELDQLGQA